MGKKILITGASGLVGSRLTLLLLQKGYRVSHLGRQKKSGTVESYTWDVAKGTIDPAALHEVDAIIHLAGAGVAEKRWTEKRKKEIIESRTKSSALLQKALQENTHTVKTVVSASAIGYYGFANPEQVFTEQSPAGTDFMAQVTRQWEEAVDKINSPAIRVVKLRIGIVLSDEGGALAELAKPVRYGFGAPLGSGEQDVSWIHLDDLCAMFIHAIEKNDMHGAYNAASGQWVTNRAMTKAIAKALDKPLWLPAVPAFALKIALGEMAAVVLAGSKVSADKIKSTGFEFQYINLDAALKNLLG